MNLNKTVYQRLKTEDFGRKVLFVMSLWSLVFGLWSGAAFADTKMQFQQANDFYKSGKFNEAAKIYDELAEGSKDHAQLYFNAANSYFRAGKLNEAILNYERAHLL